jgi:hypothetical protein
MLDGIFAKMLMIGSLRSGKLVLGGLIRSFAGQDAWNLGTCEVRIVWLDCALFVALVLDLLFRYGQHLKDDEFNLGFLEWVSFLCGRKRPGTLPDAATQAEI